MEDCADVGDKVVRFDRVVDMGVGAAVTASQMRGELVGRVNANANGYVSCMFDVVPMRFDSETVVNLHVNRMPISTTIVKVDPS